MKNLSAFIDLGDENYGENPDMLLALPFLQGAREIQGYDYDLPKAHISPGARFGLEMIRGLSGNLMGGIGTALASNAKTEALARQSDIIDAYTKGLGIPEEALNDPRTARLVANLKLSDMMSQRETATKMFEKQLDLASQIELAKRKGEIDPNWDNTKSGGVSSVMGETTATGTPLSEVMSIDPSLVAKNEGGLTPQQKAVLEKMPYAKRLQQEAQFVEENTREAAKDKRTGGASDRAVDRQKRLRDEKPVIELVPPRQREEIFEIDATKPALDDIIQRGEELGKKYGSLDGRAWSAVDPGSELGQFFRAVQLQSQHLTKMVQGARPSDYDARTFALITGAQDVFASPKDIANLMRQIETLGANRKKAFFSSAEEYYGRKPSVSSLMDGDTGKYTTAKLISEGYSDEQIEQYRKEGKVSD